MAVLRIISGHRSGDILDVAETAAVIGRGTECTFVIASAAISRQHARIEKSAEGYFVEDLNSRNGVLVNQHRINRRVQLRDGDQIRLADVVLAFQERPHKDDTVGRGRLPTRLADLPASRQTSDDSNFWSSAEDDDDRPADQSTIGPQPAATMPPLELARRRLSSSLSLGRILANAGGEVEFGAVYDAAMTAALEGLPHTEAAFLLTCENDRWQTIAARSRRAVETALEPEAIALARFAGSTRSLQYAAPAGASSNEEAEAIGRYLSRPLLCVPLLGGDDMLLGAVQFAANRIRPRFDSDDVALIHDFARRIADSLAYARDRRSLAKLRSTSQELALARQVQVEMLPRSRPALAQLELAGYELAEHFIAKDEVSGDFYDYLPLADGRLAIAIGDVAGRNVSAALVASRLLGALPAAVADGAPAEALQRLNADLLSMPSERIVTCLLAIVDPRSHEIVCANAGQLAPLRVTAMAGDATPQEAATPIGDKESGLPLGVVETEFPTFRLSLAPGEALVLLTDGVTDVSSAEGALYGYGKVRSLAIQPGLSAGEQVNRIVQTITNFADQGVLPDDLCIICLRRTAPAGESTGAIGFAHPLFDPRSAFARLRASLSASDKLLGYFHLRGERRRERTEFASSDAAAEPRIVVFAVSVIAEEDQWPRSLVRRLQPAAAVCRYESDTSDASAPTHRLRISLDGLPVDESLVGALARALIVEPKALARLRVEEPQSQSNDDAEWIAGAMALMTTGHSAGVPQILSALPELEARVSSARSLAFETPAPAGAAAPSPEALIVVLIDAAAM